MNTRIYIISFNRLSILQRSLNSYLKLNGITMSNIHIIDTSSTYLPLLEYYETIKQQGAHVDVFPAMTDDATKSFDFIIDFIEQQKTIHNFEYYAVTDPDISFEQADPDVINVYKEILEAYPHLTMVGPMLTIRDIDESYPQYVPAVHHHAAQFWFKQPVKQIINNKTIYILPATIDTTFGLLKRKQKWHRLMHHVWRVYEPYEAKHLDWYYTCENMPVDQLNYIETCNRKVANWAPNVKARPLNNRLAENVTINIIKKDVNDNLYKPFTHTFLRATCYNIKINNISFDIKPHPSYNKFWEIVNNNQWRCHVFKVLDLFLDESKDFLDIGSWICPITLYAAKKSLHVHSIEPNTVASLYASKLIKENKLNNITLHDFGIANYVGECNLYITNEGQDSLSSTIKRSNNCRKIQVKTFQTMFEMFQANNLSIIKIDIEGAEVDILTHSSQFLSSINTPVLLSIHKPFYKRIDDIHNLYTSIMDFKYVYNILSQQLTQIYSLDDLKAVHDFACLLLSNVPVSY